AAADEAKPVNAAAYEGDAGYGAEAGYAGEAEPEEAEVEEAAIAGPPPAVPTALPDISATDPKVVIESGAPEREQAESEQDVSTLEPPRREKDHDDQPKRRGWWNRFV
ncbi:MAG TPA: hypothetical protein VIR45_10335, partial [Kiloniellaceae bacterium]